MIKLTILACSILHGAECREFSAVHDVSLMICVTRAQPQLAKWQRSHPNWKIAKYTCSQVDLEHFAGKI